MSRISVTQAVERLRLADVVALPTETVYGLAGRIDSEDALKKIFAVKHRPSFDPLIVHVANVEQARALCLEWPALYDSLIAEFWPGPLTLIAKKSSHVSSIITSGLDSVAVRCPRHPMFLQVLERLGTPLAAPSANRFGFTSPTTAAHVEEEFAGAVDVVDGDSCSIGVESTVIQAEFENDKWQVKILRPGGVTRAQLRNHLSAQGVKFEISREMSAKASPGHLSTHYQPHASVVLLDGHVWSEKIQQQVEQHLKRKVRNAIELPLPATPQEAARLLYAKFRELGSHPQDVLWITRVQQGEEWEAIWDRVERSASLRIPKDS